MNGILPRAFLDDFPSLVENTTSHLFLPKNDKVLNNIEECSTF
jgi:hypothetical protein